MSCVVMLLSYSSILNYAAKIRISEHTTKQKSFFLFCIVEREYFRVKLKYTKFLIILYNKVRKSLHVRDFFTEKMLRNGVNEHQTLSFATHTLCEWVPRVVMPELGSATIWRRSFEATERL